jgi:hypothetical protein
VKNTLSTRYDRRDPIVIAKISSVKGDIPGNFLQILQLASGEIVYNVNRLSVRNQCSHQSGADEPGPAGDNRMTHTV